METYLTATEAADILGVTKATVSNWCRQGRIPGAYKVAVVWQIPLTSLDKIDVPEMGRPPKNGNGEKSDNV